jgi:predicted phosphodiesterase
VFGDTHVASVEKYEGVLLVNPGSPTLPNGLFELGTVALLEINKGEIKARIVKLREFQLSFQKESVYRRGFGA